MTRGSSGEILAIDLGTSGVKVGLFTREGDLLGFGRATYPLHRPREGWVEQDADEWWAALREAMRAALDGQAVGSIRAVCPGGQGPVLVLVDADGRPVRPAISWMDARSEPQRAQLSARLGYEMSPFSLAPKLAWVLEHEPHSFERARWALQAWDVLGYRLTGGSAVAASTFTGSRTWPDDWVAAMGLSGSDKLPPHVDAGVAYGTTGGHWAEELGLPPGIQVVGSMNDGSGSMSGAAGGVVGRATDQGGTSGGLSVCSDRPMEAPGIASWPSFIPGTWILGGAFAAGGRAVEWWADATRVDLHEVLRTAQAAPIGSHGIVFLPFLAGERAPYWDPSARGAFLGLTVAHGAAELARAVVESSGYSLRLITERILEAGARIDELRVCGGQAQSRFWNQVKADVTGFTVAVPAVTEVALMGNAVHAALGAGYYPDVVTAGEMMVRIRERLEPTPGSGPVYAELFGVYRRAYEALKPFFEPLARAQQLASQASA